MIKINQIATRAIIFFFFVTSAFAQTASLLPNAVQQFFDNNGNPLSAGTVTTYVPGTSTLKTTWQDSAEAVPNTNPIVLNAGGKAIIYGSGNYRQVIKDRNGNTIWDAVTSTFGSGGGATQLGDGTRIGTILPWSGITAPAQYVFAYGQEISRTTYSTYFTTVTYSTNVSCSNGSPILTAISDTTQLAVGAIVETACVAPGSQIISKTVSTVTVNNNASITTTNSAVFFLMGGNGNGSTTFNVVDLRGRVIAGRDNMGGTAANRLTATSFAAPGSGAAGGSQSATLVTGNLPAYTPAGTIVSTQPSHAHFVAVSGSSGTALSNVNSLTSTGTTGGPYILAGTGSAATVGLTSSTTPTITSTLTGTAQGGAATPLSVVQPTMTLNYIVKVLPDTNISTLNVVESIQGMVGVLTCGATLNCSSGALSVVSATNSVFGAVKCDGITTNCASGVITAVAGAASVIDAAGATSISNGVNGRCLYNNGTVVGNLACGGLATINAWTAKNTWSGDSLFGALGNSRPWCDVQANGAVGNGTTDDHAAIQACLTALTALTTGIIYFPPPHGGNYCNKSVLTVPAGSSISFIGSGINGSVMSACGTDTTLIALGGSNSSIYNMQFLGFGSLPGDVLPVTNPTIDLTGCSQCVIDKSTILGGSNGIKCGVSCGDFIIQNTVVSLSYRAQVYIGCATGACGGYFKRVKVDQDEPNAGSSFASLSNFAAWSASSAVVVGDIRVLSGSYNIRYTVAGTTGGSTPVAKPYAVNVTDGTATFQLYGPTPFYGVQCDGGCNQTFMDQMDVLGNSYTYGLALTNNNGGADPTLLAVSNSNFAGYLGAMLLEKGNEFRSNQNLFEGCWITNCALITVSTTWGSSGKGGIASVNDKIVNGGYGWNFQPTTGNLNATVTNGNYQGLTQTAFIVSGPTSFNFSNNICGPAGQLGGVIAKCYDIAGASDYFVVTNNQTNGATNANTITATGTHTTTTGNLH